MSASLCLLRLEDWKSNLGVMANISFSCRSNGGLWRAQPLIPSEWPNTNSWKRCRSWYTILRFPTHLFSSALFSHYWLCHSYALRLELDRTHLSTEAHLHARWSSLQSNLGLSFTTHLSCTPLIPLSPPPFFSIPFHCLLSKSKMNK